MEAPLKSFLKRIPFLRNSVIYGRKVYTDGASYLSWLKNGKQGAPPHGVKVATVKKYAQRFNLSIMVETGTYLGHMIMATKRSFRTIYSIELSPDLYHKASARFRTCANVSILQGDSGEVIPVVLERIHKPCLFWLDGHYSGPGTARGVCDTPIERELISIFTHSLGPKHVLLIDDARCFTGENGYPTLSHILSMAKSHGYDKAEVKDDIIRISRRKP